MSGAAPSATPSPQQPAPIPGGGGLPTAATTTSIASIISTLGSISYGLVAHNVPAGATVVDTQSVALGYVNIILEKRYFADADHVFSISEVIDEKYAGLSDTDWVQARYAFPIELFKTGLSITAVRSKFVTTITNNGSLPQYWSNLLVIGTMSGEAFEIFLKRFPLSVVA